MVNLRKFFALALTIFALPAAAQFIGYTSPQTTQQTLASSLTCTGGAQFFSIRNLGQVQHWLSVSSIGTTTLRVQMQGIDSAGSVYQISDLLSNAPGVPGLIYGSGWYPQFQASVVCTPGTGTFTLGYAGGWGASQQTLGSYLSATIDKNLFSGVAGNANFTTTAFVTPFGSSAGTLYFTYITAAGSGGSLSVSCQQNSVVTPVVVFTGTLANVTTPQSFPVPNFPCVLETVTYTNSGAIGTVTAEHVFTGLGEQQGTGVYTHITGTTATVAKGTPGFLHTLSINLGGAGTVSIFDLPSASCTGTPATNQIAIITATATTLQTFTYDVNALTGICVKASVAMDLTVSTN